MNINYELLKNAPYFRFTMAKTVGQIFADMAKKAGVDTAKPGFADILAIATEVPDDIATPLSSNLMSLEVAKAHPDVISHWKANVLGGIDAKINELATEYGIEPTELEALKAEKNSYNRMKLLTQFTKARVEKGFEGLSKTDKAQLVQQIDKLNSDIVSVRDNAIKEIKAAQDKVDSEITQYAFESSLRGQKWANKEAPEDVNIGLSKLLLEKYMREKGAILVRKGNELQLKQAATPDVDYIEDNKPVRYSDFVAKQLANNKLIEVTAAAPAKTQTTQQRNNNGSEQNRNEGRKQVDTSRVSNSLRERASALREVNAAA